MLDLTTHQSALLILLARTNVDLRYAEYDESQHPRDEKGQWTSGGGSNYVYHGTTSENLSSIIKNGLTPNEYGNPLNFHHIEDSSRYYAGKTGVMLRVRKSDLPKSTTHDSMTARSWTSDHVPPSDIEIEHKGKWVPLLSIRTGSAANNNHLHAVADDHVPSLTVAVMYALLKGKKTFKASRDPAAVRQAVHDALLQSLPKVLLKTMVAGGEAGVKKLGKIRTAGDVEGHPFHGNQWTPGRFAQKLKKLDLSRLPTASYDPTDERSFSEEVSSYPKKGPAGVNVTKDSKRNTLLYRDESGAIIGVLHVYHKSTSQSPKGDISIRVDPQQRGKGIASTLLVEADKRWNVNLSQQRWTDEGAQFIERMREKAAKHKFKALKGSLTSPFKMSFDASNARAAAWARDHAAELATGISDTTEQIIRDTIARTQDEGDLTEQYDEILTAIGDEDRASLIARTESMTAANEGNRQGWDQAVDAGLLTGDEKRTWIATSDACPECEALDEEETDLDGSYPGDGEDGPPLHPNCRCTEGLVL